MLIVQKFGGTSVGTVARIRQLAHRTAELVRQGIRVVTVVSAQGDTTDTLLEQAEEISRNPPARELDALLAAGEQMSAALMAMALIQEGIPSISLTGWQAGIRTDGTFGNARITQVETGRLLRELHDGKAVVVAGFQGVDACGNITTLGRGGSDTTAVALAAALHADRCRIFTDVDGIYDRDPRKHPDARRYEIIGYDEMLAMARSGAQVLHDRCVELAKENAIPLEVLSSFTWQPGTIVGFIE